MTDEELRPAGPCCVCGEPFPPDSVVNICFLDWRAPQPGTGWGCVVCGLPNDGAVAVICDGCVGGPGPVTMVCDGPALGAGRAPRPAATELFMHDRKKHEEDGSWPG